MLPPAALMSSSASLTDSIMGRPRFERPPVSGRMGPRCRVMSPPPSSSPPQATASVSAATSASAGTRRRQLLQRFPFMSRNPMAHPYQRGRKRAYARVGVPYWGGDCTSGSAQPAQR